MGAKARAAGSKKTAGSVEVTPSRGRFWEPAHGRWAYAGASCLLLAPCCWQARIQAGDLSSHVYNAWLAQLAETGRVHGLSVVHPTTNVLFDLMLAGLWRIVGAGAAQRIAVSLAVLVFVWGAFAFIAAVSGRRAWHLLPAIAMLAYGWVFHMGFFNFYLSMGLCFWALALIWEWNRRRAAVAAGMLAVAWTAHALPVVWVLCLAGYVWLARRTEAAKRAHLVAGALVGLVLLRVAAGAMARTQWSADQIRLATGADQVWVFDSKYYAVLFGVLFVWGLLFLRLRHGSGVKAAGNIPLHICLISAAGVAILPTMVQIPGFRHVLAFIAERMSLGVGILLCAVLGAVRPRAFERYALAALAVVFFGLLFRDERAINAFEDRMERAVAQLPAGQRVINGIMAPDLRIDPLTHIIDRVCVGRCYSYANYEPSTWQFRVHATAENPYVAASYEDSWLLQNGLYVVKPRDLPMYSVDIDGNGQLLIRSLRAGVPCGSTYVKLLSGF